MYHILIAGAGYVGSRIADYFCLKNQKVWAIIRTVERQKNLEKIGAVPIVTDLTDFKNIPQIPPVNFVVISYAPLERDEASYRKMYIEGTQNLLRKLKEIAPPQLIVYLSSTGVYPDLKGNWVDETTVPNPDTERGKILLEAEKLVLNSGFPSVIFRLSGIYGPGRNRIQTAKQGELVIDEPYKYINMIHVDDIVSAIPLLFKSAEPGKVYLGVDDDPVTQSEFFDWLSEKLNISIASIPVSNATCGKRLKNKSLKSLGFSFYYPTFREGYSALLNESDLWYNPLT